MEIKNAPVALGPPVVRAQLNLLASLQLGQQLTAAVLKHFPERNLVQLKLQGTPVQAYTPLKLSVGQILKLEVVKPGPLPQLRVVEGSGDDNVMVRTIRQLLPRQQSLVEFHNRLLTLSQNNSQLTSLPAPVRPIVNRLLSGLPQLRDMMRPEGVKQALENSGLMLESKLARPEKTGNPTLDDTKANLLRLVTQLKETVNENKSQPTRVTAIPLVEAEVLVPLRNIQSRNKEVETQPKVPLPVPVEAAELKNLLTKGEGALARILLDQLASLPGEEYGKQVWQLEIPIFNGHRLDQTRIKITREDTSSSTESQRERWTVELQLSPPGLEIIHCKITLLGGTVDTYFWSESDTTSHLIKNQLGLLEDRYRKVGLQTGYLEAKIGKPRTEQGINLNAPLVDENV